MVRAEVARTKIAAASARLEQAEAILGQPRARFLADPQGCDLASFYLLVAIQEVLDLAAHWVADAGWPPPADAASTFDRIAQHGEIDASLAAGLRAAAGLRNRIAHGYSGIDHARIHEEYTEGIAILRRFLAAVATAANI
jgi:uncharacterized protein YutE (UPF0331/DUF86 family)